CGDHRARDLLPGGDRRWGAARSLALLGHQPGRCNRRHTRRDVPVHSHVWRIFMFRVDWRRKRWVPKEEVSPIGTRETLCNWVTEEDETPGPFVEWQRYGELLSLLPDRIVTNLERARLSRDGRVPMLKAGLGYEELLSSVIVDGTAVHDSSRENMRVQDLMKPASRQQPGGIPGRSV